MLADLLRAFNPRLFIFHFSKSKDEIINEQEIRNYYKEFLIWRMFLFTFLRRKTEDRITGFLKDNAIDILALLYRKHDFIEKLTELGLRRKMIFKSEVPVLILK